MVRADVEVSVRAIVGAVVDAVDAIVAANVRAIVMQWLAHYGRTHLGQGPPGAFSRPGRAPIGQRFPFSRGSVTGTGDGLAIAQGNARLVTGSPCRRPARPA
ncbi:MAG: hypothetical protein ABI852_12905, partial [Gemmatimonadaceae bacterium]